MLAWIRCWSRESDRVVTVKFLHPCIPAASFVFPARQDILDIDPSDIQIYSDCVLSRVDHVCRFRLGGTIKLGMTRVYSLLKRRPTSA